MKANKLFAGLIAVALGVNSISGVAFASGQGRPDAALMDEEKVFDIQLEQEEPVVLGAAPPALDSAFFDSAENIYSIYGDAWNRATADSPQIVRPYTAVTYGGSAYALRLRPAAAGSTFSIYLQDSDYFKDVNDTVRNAVGDDNAYFGFWFYRADGTAGDVSMVIDGAAYAVGDASTGSWQFVYAKITAETQNVVFQISGDECYIDELGIYMEVPDDPTPVLTPVYYGVDGAPAESGTQYVSGYFDIGFNYAIDMDAPAEAVLENSSTGAPVPVDTSWYDAKTLRIKPQRSLDFATEYKVTVTGIQNIYGGTLEEASFTFETQSAPVRLICTETVGQGMVNSAQINGTVENHSEQDIALTLYALAQANGQTIAVGALDASVPADDAVDVQGLTLEFDDVDAADIRFSYFLLDENMMPVNNLEEKPAADMAVEAVELLGNIVTVTGAFSPAEGDRSVTVAVADATEFDRDAVVLLAETKTEPDGSFAVSGNLYDRLVSGDYTVFVWGESAGAAQDFPIYYSSRGDREAVLEIFLNGTAADIAACMNDAAYAETLNALGFLTSGFTGLTAERQEAAAAQIAAAPNKNEDTLAAIVNAAIALQVLNGTQQDRGAVCLEYAAYFGLSEAALALLEDVKANAQGLSELLAAQQFGSVADLEGRLSGLDMVLLALSSVEHQERIHALIAEYKALLNFDADALLSENGIAQTNIPSIFTELIGKTYNSAADVEYAFNKAMHNFIEGPPYDAEFLTAIYSDSVQGGYLSAWNGTFAWADSTEQVKEGNNALYINPVSAYSAGVIWKDTSLANDAATKTSLAYGTAYIGMWVYIPSGSGWIEVKLGDPSYVEHTQIAIDYSKTDCWQYIFTKVEQDVQYIIIKTESAKGIWFDDINVYSVAPEDPTAQVSALKFYDRYNEETDDQNQFAGTYFDVVYNFPTELSKVKGITIKNNATGAVVQSTFTIENVNTVRILPDTELEYDAEYTVTIGSYENVYGGAMENYTFTFKTGPVPQRFENAMIQKDSGNTTTATLTGVLYNDDKNDPNLTVYLQAQVAGETVGIAYETLNFESTTEHDVNLQVTFPETDSNAVSFSYCVLKDSMLPISVIVPKGDSAITLETAGIVRKELQISGSFSDTESRAVTAAVTTGALAEYDPAAAVALLETQTDEAGHFAFSSSLYDYLETGDYTIFVWGEGADEALIVPAYYASKNDRDAIMGVFSAGNAQEIEELLDNAQNSAVLQAMGMLTAEYSGLGALKPDVAAYIAALPAASKNTEVAAIAEVNAAIVIAMLKEADAPVEVLVEYAEYIGVGADALQLIQSILEDQRPEAVNNLIKASSFTTAEELNEILDDQLLLTAINSINSNNHLKMKELLAAYQAEVGFDAAALIKSNNISEYNEMLVYQGMIGRGFASLAECKTRFESLIAQYRPKEPVSPSGGGGGSRDTGTNGVPVTIPSITDTPAAEQNGEAVFSDIDSHWAEQSITYLYEKGVVKGKDGTQFCPNDNITREEFVKMLIPALGLADETAEAAFTDVAADRWSYASIAAAYKHGIVSGYPDGSFGAANPITREEMAVMVYRALHVNGRELEVAGETALFADDASISPYAKEAVNQLHQAGIISGAGENLFLPQSNATRAEAAQMIYSLIR